MTPVERLLERLEGVRRSGSSWAARCPAHTDRSPSLSLAVGSDGRVLLHCHAGCRTEEVVLALGLTLPDLFEPSARTAPSSPPPPPAPRPRPDAAAVRRWHEALLGDEVALSRLHALRGWTPAAIERLGLGFDGERVTFPYRDGAGELVGLGRYAPNPAQRNGGPKMRADAGSRRELFPAPETLIEGAGYLFLCEGEPDATRAVSVGLTAVGVPGVQAWRREWAERFRGRRVCLVFDCDAPGREAAQRVAGDLHGVAADLRVLDLDPSADDGHDVSAFLVAARSASHRDEARRIMERCAEMAPAYSPAAELPAPTGSEAAPGDDPAPDPPTFALEVLTAREICRLPDPSKEDRLLGPLIVRRYRTVVGGATGHGKSELMLQMLRALTTGGEFLGWKGCGGHRALVLDLEQGLGSVQVKLRRAGLGESELIDYCRVPDGLALNRDRAHIEAVEAVLARGYDVVVLDPHYKAHQGDANSERETVDLMRLLDAWRERYGFALLLPTHTRKPAEPGAKLTIHDLFGSSAFVRGAELVLGIQLVHPGYSRLHFFKDRDGIDELPVGGDPWGLLFDHEYGFRRDPNETAPPRDLEQELRELGSDCAWRTLKEWLAPKVEGGIGANEKEVRAALGRLVEAGEFEYAVGPPPRSRTAKCWRRRGATEGSWHPVAPHPSEAVPEAGATACLTPVGGVAVAVAPADRLPRELRSTSEAEHPERAS